MLEAADRVCALMGVLSNRTRLLTLCHLVEGEMSVGALAVLLDVREQALSQHLALLRKDGLVATRREGQTIFYRLARPDIQKLMAFLHATYCAPDGTLNEGDPDDHNPAPVH